MDLHVLLVPQLHHYSLTPLLCASTSLISTSFYNWCYCVSFTTTAVPSSSRNLVCLHLTHSTNCLSPLNWQHRFVMPCHFTCFVTSYHGLVMLPLLWRSTCWCHNCIIFSLFTLTPPLCGIYFAHFYILLQLVLLC